MLLTREMLIGRLKKRLENRYLTVLIKRTCYCAPGRVTVGATFALIEIDDARPAVKLAEHIRPFPDGAEAIAQASKISPPA